MRNGVGRGSLDTSGSRHLDKLERYDQISAFFIGCAHGKYDFVIKIEKISFYLLL